MRGLVLHRRVQRVFTETAESFLFNANPPRDFPSGALFIPTIPSTDHVNRPFCDWTEYASTLVAGEL